MNNLAGVFNAATYYFRAAVSLATRNPVFLGLTILMLLGAGKSMKLGRIFSVKG